MRFKAAETAVNTALAAQEKAVNAALAAQEKQTASSFLASEKAIVKAEDAQREYNVRSNEFRGQLDDQAKTLMPRPETMTMFKSFEDKLSTIKIELDRATEMGRNNLEKAMGSFGHEVAGLRESRSAGEGRTGVTSQLQMMIAGGVGALGLYLIEHFLARP
jgi:hypothetical protein